MIFGAKGGSAAADKRKRLPQVGRRGRSLNRLSGDPCRQAILPLASADAGVSVGTDPLNRVSVAVSFVDPLTAKPTTRTIEGVPPDGPRR